MLTHEIAGFASGLSAKLATRSRHVCAFFGAGTSKACGLPDVVALQQNIKGRLGDPQGAQFVELTKNRNLEQVLSRLRRIQAVAEDGDSIDGLSADDARRLDVEICRIVIDELDSEGGNLDPVDRFASWVSRSDYIKPVEVFTVNYDALIERSFERRGVPFFDGFVGTFEAPFRVDMVEAANPRDDMRVPAFYARLWKLHGSVNWAWGKGERSGQVVRLGQSVPVGELAAIFPSDAKYEESRRMPFLVLQDRFRRALNEPETLTLVSGYAWADDHLNELLFDAAARRPRSEIVAFCYSVIPDNLAAEATRNPNIQVVTRSEAIIGGIRAPWSHGSTEVKLPSDVWDGTQCNMGDFGELAKFLARVTLHSDSEI